MRGPGIVGPDANTGCAVYVAHSRGLRTDYNQSACNPGQRWTPKRSGGVYLNAVGGLMPDENDQRLSRMEKDISEIRTDVKEGLRDLRVEMSNLKDSMNGFGATLPLTYITKVDASEKFREAAEAAEKRAKLSAEDIDRRDKANQAAIAHMSDTINKLIFTVIGALITAGFALLNEIFRLIGGGHGP